MKLEKLKDAIAKMRKAIVAAITTALLVVLHQHGIQIDNVTLQVLVDTVLVSGVTYLVPNADDLLGDQ